MLTKVFDVCLNSVGEKTAYMEYYNSGYRTIDERRLNRPWYRQYAFVDFTFHEMNRHEKGVVADREAKLDERHEVTLLLVLSSNNTALDLIEKWLKLN